jgi:hypothetical protein
MLSRWVCYYFGLMLLAGALIVSAQDTDDLSNILPETLLPLPPKPDGLFTSNVNFVDFSIHDSDVLKIPNTHYWLKSGIYYDHRIYPYLVVFDEATWTQRFIRYPQDRYAFDLSSENDVLRDDNLLYMTLHGDNYDDTEIWQLNLSDWTLSLYQPKCPMYSPTVGELRDAFETGIQTIFSDEHLQFCDPKTGEILQTSSDLPYGNLSPDGKWLLVYNFDPNTYIAQLVGYEIGTGRQHELGVIDPSGDYYGAWGFWGWFGTQFIITQRDMPEWSSEFVYVGDVTKPNSLHVPFWRWRFRATNSFEEYPPRFVFVSGYEGGDIIGGHGGGGCSLEIYDVLPAVLRTYRMGFLCHPEYGVVEGIGYYRGSFDFFSEDYYGVIRFNPLTQERVQLYPSAEIEQIIWVSPDEAYAAVVTDDSGYIDAISFRLNYQWESPQHPQVTLLDLKRDVPVFKMPVEDWLFWTEGSAPYVRSSITQVRSDAFVGIDSTRHNQAILYRIVGELGNPLKVQETMLGWNALAVSAETGYWLEDDEVAGQIIAHPIFGGQERVIMNYEADRFRVDVDPQPDATWIVKLLPAQEDTAYWEYRYTIRLRW